MAAGMGERVEAAEGLYLSCGPRYSRRKMGCRRSSWSISEKIMVEGDGDGCASLLPLLVSLVFKIQNAYSERKDV